MIVLLRKITLGTMQTEGGASGSDKSLRPRESRESKAAVVSLRNRIQAKVKARKREMRSQIRAFLTEISKT